MEKFINLEELAGGAVAEKVNVELGKVLANMMDVNTDAKKKRKVVLTLTFAGSDERDETVLDYDVKTTLAPTFGGRTRLAMGKDSKGAVKAMEIAKGIIPGQVETVVDEETGELVEKVIDFRSVK